MPRLDFDSSSNTLRVTVEAGEYDERGQRLTVDVVHAENGQVPNDWHRGYQEALRDIAMKLDEAGPVGVAEWIRSNAAAPPGPSVARSHVLAPDADALLDDARHWHRAPL
jgi:hypothetical protein